VLLGNGVGGFGAKTDFTVGGSPYSVAIGDMNGDGRPDLVATSNSLQKVSVLLGNGSGGFGPRTDYSTGTGPTGVAIGDVSGDGRLDLAVTNNASTTVSVLLGLVPTRTALSVSPSPAVLSAPVTLTASVSIPAPGYGAPGDSVRFFDGTTLLGTSPVNGGVAGLALFAPRLGERTLTAVYKGDGKLFGSFSGVVSQRVAATATASISGITDVLNDQGRAVRLVFGRSPFDILGSGIPITGYQIFRRAIVAGAMPAPAAARTADPAAVQLAGWDFVTTLAATTDDIYQVTVPTFADSNSSGLHRAALFVRATTASPGIFYDSPPDSGYSVDNLPPPPPAPFTAAYTGGATYLHWGVNSAPDFWYFALHRGNSAGFTPGPSNLIATETDTGYVDAGPAGSYYKLAAVDVNGNPSGYTLLTPGSTTGVVESGPLAFSIEGVRPNPSPVGPLNVSFALPNNSPARLELLDVSGRRVAVQDVGALGAGRHTVRLKAQRAFPAGIYLVRLTQGANQRTVRAIVIE
jgi:hypothetical protein